MRADRRRGHARDVQAPLRIVEPTSLRRLLFPDMFASLTGLSGHGFATSVQPLIVDSPVHASPAQREIRTACYKLDGRRSSSFDLTGHLFRFLSASSASHSRLEPLGFLVDLSLAGRGDRAPGCAPDPQSVVGSSMSPRCTLNRWPCREPCVTCNGPAEHASQPCGGHAPREVRIGTATGTSLSASGL